MQKGEVFAQKRPKLRLDEPLVSSAVCRPVLTVSFLFLLCSAILFFFDVETRLLAALFALILCGAFWLLTRGRDVGDLRLFSVLVSCALLLVLLSETGVCLWQSRAKEVREELLRDGSTTAVTAEVCGVEEGRALLRVVRAEPISLEEYAVCDAAELSEGERVTGKAVLFLLETRTENKTLRLLGHDVSLGLAWEETPVCSGGAPLLSSFGERISDLLSEAKSASFLRAILLADKSGVSASFSRALSAVGASHLLALSGLHLG
ncbi:MAG: ComEC/Rec2 family competence protein, partial [Clostridia bacterium]|nr:ComEC/Rec2 family competence protein [Clostridia bacterium]